MGPLVSHPHEITVGFLFNPSFVSFRFSHKCNVQQMYKSNHHIQAQFFNYRQWRRHNKSVTTNDFGAKVNTHIWVKKFSDGARFWCAKAFSNASGRLSTFISRDTVDFLPLWHQTRNWGGRLWSDIQVNRYLVVLFIHVHLIAFSWLRLL